MKYTVSLQLLGTAEVPADSYGEAKAKVIAALACCGFFNTGGLRIFIDDMEITGTANEEGNEIDEYS